MVESGINTELDHELFLFSKVVNKKYEGSDQNLDIKVLPSLVEGRFYEGPIIVRSLPKYKSNWFLIKGCDCKDIKIKVSNEIYLLSHFTVADLSMIED